MASSLVAKLERRGTLLWNSQYQSEGVKTISHMVQEAHGRLMAGIIWLIVKPLEYFFKAYLNTVIFLLRTLLLPQKVDADLNADCLLSHASSTFIHIYPANSYQYFSSLTKPHPLVSLILIPTTQTRMVQSVSSHGRRHSASGSNTLHVLKLINIQARSQDIQRAFHETRKINRITNNRLRLKVPGPSSEPCPCAPRMASVALPGEELVLVVW